MPKLMEKRDWIQTVANVSSAERVWSENVLSHAGTVSLPVPEGGMYQVIFVKIDANPDAVKPKRKSAHDFIGYCRKFNPEYRSTAEIMRELREGEEKRRPVADVLIGAYAMQKGGLITRNEDDFRSLYPGLNIFNPVKANGALNP